MSVFNKKVNSNLVLNAIKDNYSVMIEVIIGEYYNEYVILKKQSLDSYVYKITACNAPTEIIAEIDHDNRIVILFGSAQF